MANKGDGKYEARDGQIVKKTTGEPIPDDEPIFILRGRDRLAFHTLVHYLGLCIKDGCTIYHIDGVVKALIAQAVWEEDNKDKMKQPGVTLGQ